MEYSGKCNGCGLCCIKPLDTPVDCPHLMRLGNGLTKCRIYGDHIGTYIGDGCYCMDIMDVKDLYEGCPYNEDKINEIRRLTNNS